MFFKTRGWPTMVVVVLFFVSSSVHGGCLSLIGSSEPEMTWSEGDVESVRTTAGLPSAILSMGSTVLVLPPVVFLGGLSDDNPLSPVYSLSLVPACLTYEGISMPLKLVHYISGEDDFPDRSRSVTSMASDKAERDRTPIASPVADGSEGSR